MDVQMHSHAWRRKAPDWPAAIGAGLVAGAVLMVLELLWSATVSPSVVAGDAWRNTHRVAAIVLGPDALGGTGFDLAVVAVALATHYLLGIVFAIAFAVVIDGFHYESSPWVLLFMGIVFGTLLYLLNFHGMSNVFPWMAEMRGWSTYIGHLVFGMTLALAYPALERRRADR
jgi:cytochrome c biogenesis protein CcdA